jgi:hypothetical protein
MLGAISKYIKSNIRYVICHAYKNEDLMLGIQIYIIPHENAFNPHKKLFG